MGDHYADRLNAAILARRTAAIVGIDPVYDRLPASLRPEVVDLPAAVAAIETFGRGVIEVVAPLVPAVKINSGFFEAFYELGVAVYYRLVAYAHERSLLVIGDVKRGDIGSTARLYACGHLAQPAFAEVDPTRLPDAVTLAGYLGENAVGPFIEHARALGKGLYVLVRPSDPGADAVHEFGETRHFYEHMAELVNEWGSDAALRGVCGLSCVGAVVAPKDAASTARLRTALPVTPFLVPGYGAQGATAAACRPCFRAGGDGAVINASRSVIYAFDNPRYRERCGDDWQAAIALACRDFAADVAQVAYGREP
ncbi:MAG: orotidine-5'-phosphate decarboxylase [Planctomycetes bacterium]|nr:orotidine-5'-phosphate decarboxylase [Planctomycetota bacterium]